MKTSDKYKDKQEKLHSPLKLMIKTHAYIQEQKHNNSCLNAKHLTYFTWWENAQYIYIFFDV